MYSRVRRLIRRRQPLSSSSSSSKGTRPRNAPNTANAAVATPGSEQRFLSSNIRKDAAAAERALRVAEAKLMLAEVEAEADLEAGLEAEAAVMATAKITEARRRL